MTTLSIFNATSEQDINYNNNGSSTSSLWSSLSSPFLSSDLISVSDSISLPTKITSTTSTTTTLPTTSSTSYGYSTIGYLNNLTLIVADEILLESFNNNNHNNNNHNNNNHNNNSSLLLINDINNDDTDLITNDINNINNSNGFFINNGGDSTILNGFNSFTNIGINAIDTISNTINEFSDSINFNNLTNNLTKIIDNGIRQQTSGGRNTGGGSVSHLNNLQISLYASIFMLAIVGNLLVILTLVQNRRMRTITNLFLLNLAISDLLLGVLCMPPTLVGFLLRDFIFGRFMCKVLPYLQACSVSVSAWTLVAISCERYYAICHPLRSRTWQTLKHAYKLIALIWIGSLFLLSPIAYQSQLIPTTKGHKCREVWTDPYEKIFNIYLDIILLIVPVLVLTGTYSLISRTLWHGMRAEKAPKGTQSTDNLMEVFINKNGSPSNRSFVSYRTTSKDNLNLVGNLHQYNGNNSYMQNSMLIKEFSYSTRRKHGLRRTNIEKSLQNKKRVIKMLFMVVLEFFICWTPLYVINTIVLFDDNLIYSSIGFSGISFFQLLAYSSSCCNPITYCFMNRGFRKAFLNLFRCFKRFRSPKRKISIGGGGTQETDLEISRLQCQRLCTDSTISY